MTYLTLLTLILFFHLYPHHKTEGKVLLQQNAAYYAAAWCPVISNVCSAAINPASFSK